VTVDASGKSLEEVVAQVVEYEKRT
jgi:hypothetical protein